MIQKRKWYNTREREKTRKYSDFFLWETVFTSSFKFMVKNFQDIGEVRSGYTDRMRQSTFFMIQWIYNNKEMRENQEKNCLNFFIAIKETLNNLISSKLCKC